MRKGDHNLFRRGDWYWLQVKIRGQRIREPLRTTDIKAARAIRDQRLTELDSVRSAGAERCPWPEAAGRWLAEYLPSGVKPGTARRYEVSLGQLDEFLAPLYLDQINRKTIARIVSQRRRVAGNATVRRDLTALSSVLSFAVGIGLIETNPARDFDRGIVRERRDPIELPRPADVDRFLARAPEGFGRVVRFLAATGMRQQEAVGLQWDDVDMKRGEITLTRTKTNRPRVVRLTSPGGDALPILRATPRHIASPYVFWHGGGVPFANFASRFTTLMRDVDTKARAAEAPFRRFRCHDLRHLFAVRWLKADPEGIYKLQRHLGHSSIRTTEIYTAYIGDHVEQVEALVEALDKAEGPQKGHSEDAG